MASLKKYNEKRDFEQTAEPAGKAVKTGNKLRFVVQRHHASRLHYDFRLEMDGVLKSWAVPKGPSLFPNDKRLAMMVEDHPIGYGKFEGNIPKGNYGFGTVSIFDEGFYEPLDKAGGEKELLAELKKGSVKVVLKGKILKGEFALVKLKNSEDNAWLLIKHKDKYAVEEAFDAEDLVSEKIKKAGIEYKEANKDLRVAKKPKAKEEKESAKNATAEGGKMFSPMLATLSEGIPDDGDWVFERKLDGFRAIAVIEKSTVALQSRNAKGLNTKFPSIAKALTVIEKSCVIDGEIVAEDSKGNQVFQLLQHGEPLPSKYKLKYYVFDILALDGSDVRNFEWSERHDLLERLLKKFEPKQVKLVKAIDGELANVLKDAEKAKWEGVLAKEKSSVYTSARRSTLWRKIKFQQTQEAIIVGYTKPEGSRKGFGALVLAVKEGGDFIYVGNVGTGFNDETLNELSALFKKSPAAKKPFEKSVEVANEKKVTWVSPKLVADITFSEWTKDEHLRHPVFKGLRSDKKVDEVTRELPVKDLLNERVLKYGKIELKLSNQKKIYWPDEGITKGQLIDYYEQIAPLMLPYLVDKPISLNRFPNGIKGDSFFQKDIDAKTVPNWLKTVRLTSENTGQTVNYLICNEEPTLLWIANMGSIEINPWLSTYKNKQNPIFAVLDLDPNGVDFKEVIKVAQTAHELFDYLEVKHYVKTSGSTGIHIFLHLGGAYSYDVARDFIEMIAQLVNDKHDDTTSLERSPAKRKDKIYLDYMQNKKGQTIAAPYSVRPKPGATVSTPLFWEEVNENLTIAQFNMDTVLQRISNHPDPWADIFDEKVDLKSAIKNL